MPRTSRIVAALTVVLWAAALGLQPPRADALKIRDEAKVKLQSVSGTISQVRHGVYEPSELGSCAFTQAEQISFQSTQSTKAYVFTGRSHGAIRTAWSPDTTPNAGMLTTFEIPGQVTVSRSATYEQSFDEEGTPGCYLEGEAENCTVEMTLPATLVIGGTSDPREAADVEPLIDDAALGDLNQACPLGASQGADGAGLFTRKDLFAGKRKRVEDADRAEEAVFDSPKDSVDVSGTLVEELAATLKRRRRG